MGKVPPKPAQILTEQEHLERWKSRDPLVSILCFTYNHRWFIEEAIQGFLSQVTPFSFEVIIRDDASTDGTSEVLKKYQDEYPTILKVIFEPENTWAHTKPFGPCLLTAKGSYIALWEGDDYWFDPTKLETQMKKIQSKSSISLVETLRYDVKNGRISGISQGGLRTYFFRNDFTSAEIDLIDSVPHGDIAMKLLLKNRGKTLTVEQPTAIWRLHDGGQFGPRAEVDRLGLHKDDLQSLVIQRSRESTQVP